MEASLDCGNLSPVAYLCIYVFETWVSLYSFVCPGSSCDQGSLK